MFKLERDVKISPSGQFSISIEAIAKLPSFKKDLACLKRIRLLLEARKKS